jgi:subtilase family serine protease
MRQFVRGGFLAVFSGKANTSRLFPEWTHLSAFILLPILSLAPGAGVRAQSRSQIGQSVDPAQVAILRDHHPLWANDGNDQGALPADQQVGPLTLVLERPAAQEQAFEQLIADQQNPASPEFRQWLTPIEVGEQFGLSDADIAAISGWLESEGLHVDWVSPGRVFIGFSGTAGALGRAFGTEFHAYQVNGERRIAANSEPTIPQALAPAIQAVRGLFTIEDRPLHHATPVQQSVPEMTVTGGGKTSYFIAPADFDTIYNVPTGSTGAGETIGIVSESRTDFADFANFRAQTGSTFPNPTEVIPTTYGGADPGAAYTTEPAAGVSISSQVEATLDVTRSGSVAPGASLLLVAASSASGGIVPDAEYLVDTSPVPAHVMSISFGECESSAGSSGVAFWNTLFEQAVAEGISVLVASGDSGASGCDAAFTTPPASPAANSQNAICSSSYVTCVGGTEFADANDPTAYWSASNGTGLLSAIGYIPEGGWNEPGTSGDTQVASSGGGVSAYVATPSWQTGTGVPSARTGRYTPDVAFTASCHDSYFGCLAADGASCVAGSSGSYYFVGFCGTSASAPGMAGVAALLNQKLGTAQGNLNAQIYAESASTSAAFHDVTVTSSGVTSCSVSTPSMCNNSIPSATSLTGGQAGYLVTAGFDEVTGLGSLNVSEFLDSFTSKLTPTVTVTPSPKSITTAQTTTVTVTVSGGSGNPTPTGTVTLTSGSYASAATTLAKGAASITTPAGSLSAGTDTLSVSYEPDGPGSTTYVGASGSSTVTVTSATTATPTVTLKTSATKITTAETLTVTVTVAPTTGNPTPTGTVKLASGSYTSAATTLASGSASIVVPAGSLATGTDTLTATYTPDSTSSPTYNSATGTGSVTVTAIQTPTVTVSPSPASITTAQTTTVAITVAASGGYATPTGTVTLSSGGYTSSAVTLASGGASITVPAGALATGTDTLTATYTPDSASSQIYAKSTGTSTVTVSTSVASGFSLSAANVTLEPGATSANTSKITVTPTGGFTGSVALTAQITASPTGANDLPTLSFGSTSPVVISSASAGTATLTISTTAPTTGALALPPQPSSRWIGAGGAVMACLVFFFIPVRRRSWLRRVSVVLIAVFAGLAIACSGGSGGGTPPPSKITPTVTVVPTSSSITAAQALQVNVAVTGAGNPPPSGTVTLTSGSYTSAATTLAGGDASITIPAGSLTAGNDTLNVAYAPDAASSSTYLSASGSGAVTVTAAANPGTTAGNYTVTVTGTSGATTQTTTFTLTVQ